jgi:putative ABC transport system permease protein
MVDPLTPAHSTRLRAASRVLRCLSWLVPRHRRDEWLREWEGEVSHYLAAAGSTGGGLARRLAGALPHALWLRRAEWRLAMLMQDATYAWRGIRKRPAFAALVIGMLALGIGTTTAMFTIVNSVLLEPLPYPEPDRLVVINGTTDKIPYLGVSAPDLIDYRAQNSVFTSLAGSSGADPAVLSGQGEAAQVTVMEVTANYFTTLGVTPFLGRAFLEGEESGAERVILSYQLWQSRFGADRSIIGRSIILDGRPTDVVGVMPHLLDNTLAVELFRPFNFRSGHSSVRAWHTLSAIGRLKEGIAIPQATVAMNMVATRLEQSYPEDAAVRVRLRPYQEAAMGGVGRVLFPLFGAVGLVLLIACGNAASLLLGRAAARGAEITTRIALGATRTDLTRLLLTESLMLSVTAGVLGAAFTFIAIHLVRGMPPRMLPRIGEVTVDIRVLVFTMAVAVSTGLVFGAAPVLHIVSRAFGRSPNATHGRSSGRLRDLVVATQVALSLVLLVGAGLMLRSLEELRASVRGFEANGVLTATVSLPTPRYNAATQVRFWDDFLHDLRGIPDVRDASGAMRLATALSGGNGPFWAEGHAPVNDAAAMTQMAQRNVISDRYFETMRIPIVDGTSFDDPADRRQDGVIINRHIADRLFPGQRAVGKRLIAAFGPPVPLQVVGVVGDVLSPIGPIDVMYFPASQMPGFLDRMTLTVRTDGDPARLVPAIRRVLATRDRELPLTNIRTMTEAIEQDFAVPRSISTILTVFAVLALMLALIGVYGALAHMVALRTRELGIRAALGAQRTQLFAMIIRRGMTVVTIGILLGTAAAFAATKVIQSLLYHVKPTDPRVFVLTVATLAVAGLLACVVPARRATRVDPNTALRAE